MKPGCKTAVMDGVAGRPEGAVPAAPVRWRHLAAVCGQRGQPRQGRERRGEELHLVVCLPHAEGAVMGQTGAKPARRMGLGPLRPRHGESTAGAHLPSLSCGLHRERMEAAGVKIHHPCSGSSLLELFIFSSFYLPRLHHPGSYPKKGNSYGPCGTVFW